VFGWEPGDKLLKSKFQAAEVIDAKAFEQSLRRVSVLVHAMNRVSSLEGLRIPGGTKEQSHVILSYWRRQKIEFSYLADGNYSSQLPFVRQLRFLSVPLSYYFSPAMEGARSIL